MSDLQYLVSECIRSGATNSREALRWLRETCDIPMRKQSIISFEAGQRGLTLLVIDDYAAALGVRSSEILAFVEDVTPKGPTISITIEEHRARRDKRVLDLLSRYKG